MPAPIKLKTNTAYGPRETAVSLALALLRKAKVESWDDYMAGLRTRTAQVVAATKAVALSPDQLALMSEHQGVLRLLHMSTKVMPVFCPVCGKTLLIADQQAAPAKCKMTSGCGGSPVKPAAATQDKS